MNSSDQAKGIIAFNMSIDGQYEPPLKNEGVEELPFLIAEAILITFSNFFSLTVFVRIGRFDFLNFLFIALSLSDLLLGLMYIPILMVFKTLSAWPLGAFMCYFFQISSIGQYMVATQISLVLAAYRYMQLSRPLFEKKINKLKIMILIFTWVGPYAYATGLVLVFKAVGLVQIDVCQIKFPFAYVLAHDILLSVVPTSVSIFLGVLSLRILHKNLKTAAAINQRAECRRRSAQIVKARRDFKGGVCVFLIAVTLVINEYIFDIVWLIVSGHATRLYFTIISWTTKNMFIYPILNPVLLFFFNHKFKKHAISLILPFLRILSCCRATNRSQSN